MTSSMEPMIELRNLASLSKQELITESMLSLKFMTLYRQLPFFLLLSLWWFPSELIIFLMSVIMVVSLLNSLLLGLRYRFCCRLSPFPVSLFYFSNLLRLCFSLMEFFSNILVSCHKYFSDCLFRSNERISPFDWVDWFNTPYWLFSPPTSIR